MSDEQLRETVQGMRDTAIGAVRLYARLRCPLVKEDDVQAIERALGDISIFEACDVLARIQREIEVIP